MNMETGTQTTFKTLLKASEITESLNISKAMAYRLMQRGEIPCVHIGTAVRVRPADLVTYIQDNITGETPG